MDIDHEARKHDVPPSTVQGEGERTAAEDPAEQVQNQVDDAKDSVDDAAHAQDGREPGPRARHEDEAEQSPPDE